MVGQIITDKDGNPIEQASGNKLSPSTYNPSDSVKKLFSKCQNDYQLAWRLQHRPFKEFDGYSLLQRTNMDQETFAAYVGAEYVPQHKKWRWRGRKNTARNKLIGILAHMIAGMLFPFVYATNEQDEEDKMTARVMRILVENHLKDAGYETQFLFMVCSALVNPAVLVEVEYVQAFQRIKQQLANGEIKVIEAVDMILSGIGLNILPVDQLLLADFYTFNLQRQPFLVKVRRIAWDEARQIYSGKYFDKDGTDLFEYVEAGKTRIVMAGQEYQTLYDIQWTEADRDYVQELTFYYRHEDLEVTFVGGVFMGEEKDIYNSNPFKHRRMSLIGDEWVSVPIYPFAKSGFEPLDPIGRFAYYKSGAFKEYWDALGTDRMFQIAFDGTYLDVIKPMFLSGVTKVDGTVMIPGATVAMPAGATAVPYQLGPNLSAALNMLTKSENDLSESTQDKIMTGVAEKGVTAYATQKAEQNARIFLGVFGVFVSDLIKQIGELTMDCIIQHTTVGEIDATIPEALRMRFRTIVHKGKENGKDVTNRIIMTDKYMGRKMTEKEIRDKEWDLFDKAGGTQTDQRIYEVNPYNFARHKFQLYIDPDQIVMKSMGADKQRKALAFQMLTDPRVLPFTDPEAVANKLVIEEFSDGDPDQFKKKGNSSDAMINAMFGVSKGQMGQDRSSVSQLPEMNQ